MNPRLEDQIESYLRGDLSSEESASFEQQMQNDPVFKSNVAFEQNVVRGLADVRKAELKSRLSAIQPPSGYLGYWGGSSLLKIAGSFLTIALIGTASYFYFDDFNTPQNTDIEFISNNAFDHPKNAKDEITEISIPSVQKSEQSSLNSTPAVNEILEVKKVTQKIVDESKSQLVAENVEKEEATEEEFVPAVDVPALSDVDDNTQSPDSNADMPEISSTDKIEDREEPIDVKTIQRTSESLKYRYYEGKLFLYGDFKENPYEILEINSTGSRKIYLFFMETYYEVEMTDKIQELQIIDNQKLVDELEILRNNKF